MDAAGNLTHARQIPTATANQWISQAPVNSLLVQIKAERKKRISDKESADRRKGPAIPETQSENSALS
jgi:hypothetical protein